MNGSRARTVLGRIFMRKTVEHIQEETRTSELKRSLNAWHLILLGVGCIVGAGIFVRTGNAAALHAGPAVLISFAIAGVVCALSGLCYAELASTLPVSGSAYTYSYATLGEFAAWIMGCLLLLEYGVSAAVVAVGWSGYMVSLLSDIGIAVPPALTGPAGQIRELTDGTVVTTVFNLPACLVCLALSLLLVLGLRETARVNTIIVAIKVGVIMAFILVSGYVVASHWDSLSANWSPFIPEPTGDEGEFGWSGILRAASIVFYAYIGFEAVSTASQETHNPQRDMPIGIIGSLVVVTTLYILVSIVLTLVVNYRDLNVADPLAVAVDTFGPQWAWFAATIKVGAIVGLTSVILVLMYGQTRIFYTIARDGLLPRIFANVHRRYRTPWINTLVVGFGIALAAGVFDINFLGDMTSVGTLAAFGIVCLTVLWLRITHPGLERGFRVPLYPVLPICGIISCFALIFTVEWRVLQFFGWFVLGSIILYFVYGMWNSRLARDMARRPGPNLPEFPEDAKATDRPEESLTRS